MTTSNWILDDIVMNGCFTYLDDNEIIVTTTCCEGGLRTRPLMHENINNLLALCIAWSTPNNISFSFPHDVMQIARNKQCLQNELIRLSLCRISNGVRNITDTFLHTEGTGSNFKTTYVQNRSEKTIHKLSQSRQMLRVTRKAIPRGAAMMGL